MGRSIPMPRYREIGEARGSAKDVAEEYGVAITTVYKARRLIEREQFVDWPVRAETKTEG